MSKEPLKESIEFSSVQVHQPATVKNATESNFRAEKGYLMVKDGDCIYIEYKDTKFLIPMSNVIIAVLK